MFYLGFKMCIQNALHFTDIIKEYFLLSFVIIDLAKKNQLPGL